jgi:homoserine kinase
VSARRITVRAPASSANLGAGFDCLAVALDLELELEVSEAGEFALSADPSLPQDRTNLVVRAFERLHPADGLHFRIASAIPLSGGLGSSAAAVVAGLLAAARFAGVDADLFALASEIEGHADNAAAAIYGGVVICADGVAHRLDPPEGLSLALVVPDAGVATALARAALPAKVDLADAVFNTAHAALLIAGLQNGDLDLVSAGLVDRLHQRHRAHLYPRSAELLDRARSFGALGATISGAGPSVLVWSAREQGVGVSAALESAAAGWATVLDAGFASAGASASEC